MRAVSIRDVSEHHVTVDLAQLLRLTGAVGLASSWRCSNVECVGSAADRLHSASDDGRMLSGADLLAIATELDQVVDGDFVARRQPAEFPWLAIRAIDSSEYVVITEDDDLLTRIRETFNEVSDSPEDVAFLKPP